MKSHFQRRNSLQLAPNSAMGLQIVVVGRGVESGRSMITRLGFSVRTEITGWDPSGHVGEYGWGGAASTHYWVSPQDKLIVITLEQIMPYQWDTAFGVKKIIYDAVRKCIVSALVHYGALCTRWVSFPGARPLYSDGGGRSTLR